MRALLLLSLLAGCASMRQVRTDLGEAERLLAESRKLHAELCASRPFAEAEAQASFARIELDEGDAWRASEHVASALVTAKAAWTAAQTCGVRDQDADGIPDIVDKCPQQAEDIDGDADEDGCRDLDPYADADRDSVRNIDDDCVEEAEDFDGHNDEDGCPETSEDSDGDTVIDAVDVCPTRAEDLDGFEDKDGCPDEDNDKDSIPDARDLCPLAAEDLDDWQDEDGCPETDNDSDGVSDADDACPNNVGDLSNRGCPGVDRDRDGVGDSADLCPNEAETVNGWLDLDGCPDTASSRIKVTQTRIELIEPITFANLSADLEPGATKVLDDVARALKELRTQRLRIEGHTEAVGDEQGNEILSRRRAEAVFDYLVSQGVAAERLDVKGLGGTRPIDTNRTEAGRTANRRIELWIVKP